MLARILLVDDELALTKLLEKYLNRLGYYVESHSNPRNALESFSSASPPFDLLVADMTMPEMSGEELLAQLTSLDIRVRVLLCSGYPFDLARVPEGIRGRVGFLQKPFLPKMLSDAVVRLLGHSASSSAS